MRWGWGCCEFLAPTQGRPAVPPQICPCLFTAAIPGYQHTPDSLSARATQFYITKIDAANREHKLEDKGEPEPCKVPPSSLTASGRVVDLPGQGARDCLAQGEPRCDGGPQWTVKAAPDRGGKGSAAQSLCLEALLGHDIPALLSK